MLRSVILLVISAVLAHGAIFPDQIGAFKKGPPTTVSAPDLDLCQLADRRGVLAPDVRAFLAGRRRAARLWRRWESGRG